MLNILNNLNKIQLHPKVVMNARIPHTIVIRKLVDAFVHRTVKVSIAINARPIPMAGNIKKGVSYAIAIISVRLDKHVICIVVNVCAVKDSPVDSVIDARSATLDIQTVNVATVIVMVH